VRHGRQAWERWRTTATDTTGRRLPRRAARELPATPHGTVNLTDPDTQLMMGHKQFVQGYNAQAVVTEDQIVLAAEISTRAGDFPNLRPMITAPQRELHHVQIETRPQVALADAGFWNEQHRDHLAAQGITVLIPPDAGNRTGERPGWTGGRYSWMRQLLTTDTGSELYRTQEIDRAGVRSHQAPPQIHPVSPPRSRRPAHRVAITDDDPQPHQAPRSPHRHRERLKRAPGITPANHPPRHPRLHAATPPPATTARLLRQPLAVALVRCGEVATIALEECARRATGAV
jgi:hypothetical protein